MNISDAFRNVRIDVKPVTNAFEAAARSLKRSIRYSQATLHRKRLIASGEYIKTSQQRGMGLMQFINEEPQPYEPDHVGSWGKRLEQLRNSAYPRQTLFPHHHGAALWMPSEPGSRHWPGCGCP